MADEDLWRRRFYAFMLLRLSGVATFLVGLWIAFGDAVREGGWPVIGVPIALLGAADAVLAPRILKAMWDRQDR